MTIILLVMLKVVIASVYNAVEAYVLYAVFLMLLK